MSGRIRGKPEATYVGVWASGQVQTKGNRKGESVEQYLTRSAEDFHEVERRGASWVAYDVVVRNGWWRRNTKWKRDGGLLVCDVAPKIRAAVSRSWRSTQKRGGEMRGCSRVTWRWKTGWGFQRQMEWGT